jgi:hypothetical protein
MDATPIYTREMPASAPNKPQRSPTAPSAITHDGRSYPLLWERSGWRLRSRAKSHPADYRTGTTNLRDAQKLAKDWLARRADDPATSRKGGGTLEALATIYLETPKRTKANVARDNVSRLRSICRLALGKELSAVTCREIGPEFWQRYQRASLERAGRVFDLVTRYRENVAINAATRAARCLFLPVMLRAYRSTGLDVNRDAGESVPLPVPYVPPAIADDATMLEQWAALDEGSPLWLTVGLARFAGLRREEIANCRASWIHAKDGVASIDLRDRPDEQWWTKTGKPYRAQVIEPALSAWLIGLMEFQQPDTLVIPATVTDRARWFEREPQAWLRVHGIEAAKPLHRLRGLYADHVAKLTADAVTARLAAVRAAQKNLGHTTSAVTEAHYLSTDALR